MKCEAEDPTGHLPVLFRLVFELGKLGKDDVLVTRQFVIVPLDRRPFSSWHPTTPPTGHMEYIVEYGKTVVGWEVPEISLKQDSPSVPLVHILENARCWIHGREMGKRAEATYGRQCCKLLQLSSNHQFVNKVLFNDRRATDENIKAS